MNSQVRRARAEDATAISQVVIAALRGIERFASS